MFFPILLFNSILKYNIQLSCITLLQDKMSKHLRDIDDVDIDDDGSITPKKTTSRNLASPIKVQFTPTLKRGKVFVQTKRKQKKASLQDSMRRPNTPSYLGGARAFLKGQLILLSSRSCLLMLMTLDILYQIQHHSLRAKKLRSFLGHLRAKLGF